MLALALAVSGCAALGAALRTDSALHSAGYQNASVNVQTGSGLPSGGLIGVSYSRGPSGNDERDALGAEKIVWDTFPGRFGAVVIVKVSGGCAGPVCATHSSELASATYAQLAARLGARPHGLDKASPTGNIRVPGWALFLGLGLAVAVIAAAAFVLVLILRRNRKSSSGPPQWQPGTQQWPAGPPQWPAGPHQWQPGPQQWQPAPQPGPEGPPPGTPGSPGDWPTGSPH